MFAFSCWLIIFITIDILEVNNDVEMTDTENTNVGSTGERSTLPPHQERKKPCSFFAIGTCRNGANCRFSHELDAR